MSTALTKPRSKPEGRRTWRFRLLQIAGILLVVLLLAFAGGVAWAEFPPSPMPEAVAALQNDNNVTIDSQRWIEFVPTGQQPTTGFIFYPGGRVDARAYSPMLHQIAQAGYYAVIVPMRFNLAFFSPDRADDVIAAHPEIQHWVIGGHSLGGVMAASYAYNHPEQIQGLVFWASYPMASNSLADRDQLQVTSIYGTNDGLTSVSDIEASKANLPKQTNFVAIEGGNHGQFGWYGPQSGDNPAAISRAEQQTQTVAATLALLQNVQQ
ncbi:MAG: alpha/beta hydrolase [Caldilineaceae bacterium]